LPSLETALFSCFTPGEKVIAGLSGGTFSALAAWAAKEAGGVVEGVTLLLYEDDIRGAEKTAARLGINLNVADYRSFFGEDVLSVYFSALKDGRVPLTCEFCAARGRTAYLFKEFTRLNAQKFVTGDLARVAAWKDGYAVYKARSGRDASRSLALVNPLALPYMLTPLGEAESSGKLLLLAKKLGLDNPPDRKKPCSPSSAGVLESIGANALCTVSPMSEIPEKRDSYIRNIRLANTVFRKDEPPVSEVSLVLGRGYKKIPALLEIFFGGEASILTDKPMPPPPRGEIAALYSGERLIGGGICRRYE
jgi:hypothetical protein